MKLFVIILCMLSERFLMHSLSYKRFIWFEDYCKKMKQLVGADTFQNPWMLLAAFILPLVLIPALLYFLFQGVFFGFIGLVLNLLIFFYCLGPHNPFYPVTENEDQTQKTILEQYLVKVNGQLFAVLFWYILGGPIAALLYRLVSLCRPIEAVRLQATQITDVLDWIPARLSVLLFLLVGNFQRGFSLFMHYLPAKPALNDRILGECGLLAVQTSEANEVSIVDAEKLVEHAAFVLLVFIALFTLIAWL